MTPLEKVRVRLHTVENIIQARKLKVGDCFCHPIMGSFYSTLYYTVLEPLDGYDWQVQDSKGRKLLTPFISRVSKISQEKFLEEERKHERYEEVKS